MITPAALYQRIVDLHERGYSDDFQLVSKGILWVQQKIVLPGSEFSIVDRPRGHSHDCRKHDTIILGVLLVSYGVKGILICHPSAYPLQRPDKLHKKIHEVAFAEEL